VPPGSFLPDDGLDVVFETAREGSEVLVVTLPASSWITDAAGKTAFHSYHKNVLGLPFLISCGAVVFDDHHHVVRVQHGQVRPSNDDGGDAFYNVTVPIELWDVHGNPAVYGVTAPRFAIGRLRVGDDGPVQAFTYDLGNPRFTTLVAKSCRGCDDETMDRCPASVPECPENLAHNAFCWPSHPSNFVPSESYTDLPDQPCPAGVIEAGTLNGTRVCSMCFDHGDHSRFFTQAVAARDVELLAAPTAADDTPHTVVATLPARLHFGALLRTVPLVDRVWANVGVGFNSSFLHQTRAPVLLLRARTQGASAVVFNPDPALYARAPSAPFAAPHNRLHALESLRLGDATLPLAGALFLLDTGNDNITLADPQVRVALAAATRGTWSADDGRLHVPRTYLDARPTLTVTFRPGIAATLPVEAWAPHRGGDVGNHTDAAVPTIFSAGSKVSVLGLPFIAGADVDLVFDDHRQLLYIVGGKITGS